MLVRVRSNKGTSRLDVAKDATVRDLAYKAACDLNVSIEEIAITFDFQGENKVEISEKTLVDSGIGHGSMVYVSVVAPSVSEGKEEKDAKGERYDEHKVESKDHKGQRTEEDAKHSSTVSWNEHKDDHSPPPLQRQETDEETRRLIEQLQKEDQANVPSSPTIRAPDPSRRMNLLAPDPIDEIGGTRWLADDAYDPLRYGVGNFGTNGPRGISNTSASSSNDREGTGKVIDEEVVKELLSSGVSEYDIMLMTQRITDEEIAKRYQQQDFSSNRSGMSDLEQARALHRKRMQEKGLDTRRGRNQRNDNDDPQERAMREVDKILSRVTSTASSMQREFSQRSRGFDRETTSTARRFDELLNESSASSSSSSRGNTGISGNDTNAGIYDDDNDAVLQQLLMDGVLEEVVGGGYEQTSAPNYSNLEREWRDEVNRLNMNADSSTLSGTEDTNSQLQKAIEESVNEIDTDFERALAASMVNQPVETIQGEVSIIQVTEDDDDADTNNTVTSTNENEDELLAKALAASLKDF